MATKERVGMAQEPPPTLGKLLKHYREATGLTQEELAERARLSVRGLSNLERGQSRVPRRDTLDLLASALGLSARERAQLLAAVRPAAAASAPPHASSTATPVVGRDAVLSVLERHLAGDGAPLFLLAGEPGIGKTRLLQEVAALAVARGLTVLAGSGRRGGGEPYGPILEAFARYIGGQDPHALRRDLEGCSWLVRLLPELADGPIAPLPAWTLAPEQERRLVFAAAARFLHNVAGRDGTTLLVLDDLHWADADTLDLLAGLVRAAAGDLAAAQRRDGLPLYVVGAFRDTDVQNDHPLATLLTTLAPAGLARREGLAPLTQEQAARLLDNLLVGVDGVDRTVRERVLQRAGGVPFFLVSFAQGLRAQAVGSVPDSADAVPWDLAQGVWQRVTALQPGARAVLAAAAVIGHLAPRALLLEVAGRPAEEVRAGLDAASHARLLLEEGPGDYRFAHEVIREVIEVDLGAAERAALHHRVAAALERTDPEDAARRPVEALAYHYGRTDDAGKAVLYLEQAGDRARERGAHAAAQGYYREAVEKLDRLGRPRDAARLRLRLGQMLRVEGRDYAAALQALDAAAAAYRALGDRGGLGHVAADIGYAHIDGGTFEEGARRLEELRDALEAHLAEGEGRPGLAMLLTVLAQLYYRSGRFADHVAAVERAVTLARATDDVQVRAAAELSAGLLPFMLGRVAEGAAALDAAAAMAEAAGVYTPLLAALTSAAAMCVLAAEFDLVLRYAERARRAAEQVGDAAQLVFIHYLLGEALRKKGAWSAAAAALEYGAALGARADRTDAGASSIVWTAFLGLGAMALERGEPDVGRAYLEEGMRMAHRTDEVHAIPYVQGMLAQCAIEDGRTHEALALLRPLLAVPDLPGVTLFVQVRLAWALYAAGDMGAADAAASAVARARAEGSTLLLMDALWIQGRVAAQLDHWDESLRALGESLALARRTGYALGEVRAIEAFAELHLRRGERDLARERLEEARALLERLDAPVLVARIARTIAALPQ